MTESITTELAALEKTSTAELKDRWRTLMGGDPPAYSRRHLIRRLSFRLQEIKYGGLSEVVSGQLKRALEERHIDPFDGTTFLNKAKQSGKARQWSPPVGSIYKRDWRGKEYVLTILDTGVDMNGSRFKSTSEAAISITGVSTNGFRFWKIVKRNRSKQ